MVEKCDNCRLWAFGCELSGQSRKACLSNNYRDFKPKALGYSLKEDKKNGIK